MKKLLFISSLDSSNGKFRYDGVMKKILYQIKTLEEMQYDVDYIQRIDDSLFLCNHSSGSIKELIPTKDSFYGTMRSFYRYLCLNVSSMRYDVIYVRFEHLSRPMSRFLKRIKANNKDVVRYVELPTYMGKWEPGGSLLSEVKFIVNWIIRKIIPLNADYVITFSDHKRLFNTPTIRIENFADVSQLPIRRPTKSDDFHMMGLAMMTPSHGFDRVINGLKAYYQTKPPKKVYFHIIGKGSVVPVWQKLVGDYGLEDYVIFEGVKSGAELDDYFNLCQIAVASLAIFRKKCPKASELKIREYTARGIPFIYSAFEPQYEGQSFCLKVPHDESPINIFEVIDYYYQLDEKRVADEMRAFALKYCTCRAQLERVFSISNDEKY